MSDVLILYMLSNLLAFETVYAATQDLKLDPGLSFVITMLYGFAFPPIALRVAEWIVVYNFRTLLVPSMVVAMVLGGLSWVLSCVLAVLTLFITLPKPVAVAEPSPVHAPVAESVDEEDDYKN